MSNNVTVELDDSFLTDFFKLVSKTVPNKEDITCELLKLVLNDIKEKIKEPSSKENENNENKENNNNLSSYMIEEAESNLQPIFIIDDLGVITYQLSVLLKKSHFEPTISQEVFDAIEKFKAKSFPIVVMDLFIPTEREGLLLLDELLKITKQRNDNTKIVVMSASLKKEHKIECLNKGAALYIEKKENWQKELIEICKSL